MKLNKKICILTSVHPVFDTRIFYKEAKTLANAGYDVTLIAQHDKNETVDRIKIIALQKPKNRIERFLKLDYLTYKKALQQKADIYHFHDPELLPWALKLKKKTKAKIIYDIHENIPGQIMNKEWIPRILRKLFSFIYKKIEKKIIPNFDHIILAEDSYKEYYSRDLNKTVIKNYPIISEKGVKKTQNKEFGTPKLVYVGGISKNRGIFEILESVIILKKNLPETKLIIAGKIPLELESKIKKIIKINSLKDNIELLGRINYTKIQHIFFESNIGLCILRPIPNYISSLPTKLLEYMTAGLPVIVSDFPINSKLINKEGCGLTVDPKKPEEIAKAIEYLIEHPNEAKKMGENGRKAVLEKYNWDIEAKKLLEVYKNLTLSKPCCLRRSQ